MDEVALLESKWNQQIDNFKQHSFKREEEYLNFIKEKDSNLILRNELKVEIPKLENELEKIQKEIYSIEQHPSFSTQFEEYRKEKELEKVQIEGEKLKRWQDLAITYQKAIEDIDIEQAQTLLEQMELIEEKKTQPLKSKLIQLLKNL